MCHPKTEKSVSLMTHKVYHSVEKDKFFILSLSSLLTFDLYTSGKTAQWFWECSKNVFKK